MPYSYRPRMPSLLARESERSPVIEQLLSVFRSETYHPPQLPSTALQLLELAKKPDVQPGVMIALLERDPMLAAEVLRLAQSALYGGSVSVRTLDEAIVRLGLRRVGELFLHAALETRVFRAKGYERPMDQLRRHSVAVAQLSRVLGRETGLESDGAFLCGLLHDVGIATSLIAIVESAPPGSDPPSFDVVWPAVARVHQYAGGLVASQWRFPSEITFVIERHHDFVVDGRPHPLASLVYLADWAASELGYGFQDEQSEVGGEMVLDALGLDAPKAQAILSEAAKALKRVV